MDEFWKLWSEALEKGYLEFLTESKKISKHLTGRGKISIVEIIPKRKEMAGSVEEVRKGGSGYAVRLLKQARRCEQVAYILELISKNAGDEKAGQHIMLNQQALKKIEEMAEQKLEWGKDIKGET